MRLMNAKQKAHHKSRAAKQARRVGTHAARVAVYYAEVRAYNARWLKAWELMMKGLIPDAG
jgi:hypothetical protein